MARVTSQTVMMAANKGSQGPRDGMVSSCKYRQNYICRMTDKYMKWNTNKEIYWHISKPNGEERCTSEISKKITVLTSFNLCISFSLKPSSSEFERKFFSSLTS